MNVASLDPRPSDQAPFRRDHLRRIPPRSGCYALATVDGAVLYVGLAVNLRQRLTQHLDTPAKTAVTDRGRARYMHWLEAEHREQLERTWMNLHLLAEGALPVLNKAYSPVAT